MNQASWGKTILSDRAPFKFGDNYYFKEKNPTISFDGDQINVLPA